MLTKDEAELYDRQIRLWGVNAQSRLRQSRVLMLGFNGIASEVAKILVLAGIDTLTIVDDQPLQEADLTSNLFCRPNLTDKTIDRDNVFRTHQVKEKLSKLNPLVNLVIDNSPILSKKSEDFKNYDLVTLHSFLTIEQITSINQICRDNKAKFYLVFDYGFFGFMFNDLGPNFKFTYEKYDQKNDKQQQISRTPTPRQSGEEKDPINFDNEDDKDHYRGSSDEDDRSENRPKKRRRVHSPQRQTIAQLEDKNDKKHIVEVLAYARFDEMISSKGANFDRKSSPVLFTSIAILKFFSEHRRLPTSCDRTADGGDKRKQDIANLNEIIATLKDSLSLPESIFAKLDPEWSLNIDGSISPVCAVVGGVAGQDMIRSLSNRDIPIYNTFSFDGMSMLGTVERLGVVSEKMDNAPVVRDYLEID